MGEKPSADPPRAVGVSTLSFMQPVFSWNERYLAPAGVYRGGGDGGSVKCTGRVHASDQKLAKRGPRDFIKGIGSECRGSASRADTLGGLVREAGARSGAFSGRCWPGLTGEAVYLLRQVAGKVLQGGAGLAPN